MLEKKFENFLIFLKKGVKTLDKYTQWVYNVVVKLSNTKQNSTLNERRKV